MIRRFVLVFPAPLAFSGARHCAATEVAQALMRAEAATVQTGRTMVPAS